MAEPHDCSEDEVLKRMLRTPHKKHEPTTPLGKRRRQEAIEHRPAKLRDDE